MANSCLTIGQSGGWVAREWPGRLGARPLSLSFNTKVYIIGSLCDETGTRLDNAKRAFIRCQDGPRDGLLQFARVQLLLNLFSGDYLLSQIDSTEALCDCVGRSPPLPKARKITHPKGASCHELLTSGSWPGKPDCFASVCGNSTQCRLP